ncbi:UNVERIFIED_CONTAM: hypothetical protein NCL1_37911 [Trichonephila clavipes]
MKDAFDMWELPSVLHFPDIKEAYLTYPYHCCAFKFPNTHDPWEFSRLQSLRRDVHRRFCTSTTPEDSTVHVTMPTIRKRSASSSPYLKDDAGIYMICVIHANGILIL